MTLTQTSRFLRLFLFAIVPAIITLAAGGGPVTVAAVAGIAVAGLETAWRQVHPTQPVPTAAAPAKKAA